MFRGWNILAYRRLMTVTTLIISGLIAFATVAFVFAMVVWNKAKRDRDNGILAQMELRKLQKKTKATSHLLDLELATTPQIIEELRKRPNNQFLMLIPHQQSEDIYVETHICNIAPQAVLMMLKVAYDGVSDALEEGDDGEQWSAEGNG